MKMKYQVKINCCSYIFSLHIVNYIFNVLNLKLGQKTTSPKPDRKSFKNKRHRQNAFLKYFEKIYRDVPTTTTPSCNLTSNNAFCVH